MKRLQLIILCALPLLNGCVAGDRHPTATISLRLYRDKPPVSQAATDPEMELALRYVDELMQAEGFVRGPKHSTALEEGRVADYVAGAVVCKVYASDLKLSVVVLDTRIGHKSAEVLRMCQTISESLRRRYGARQVKAACS